APYFHLGEAAVVGRHYDVGREHEFDAHGEADSLDGRHHRLGAPAVAGKADVVWLDQSLVTRHWLLATFLVFRKGRQIHAAGEVVANGVQHADPKIRVVFEPCVGLRQLPEHDRRYAVALRGAI